MMKKVVTGLLSIFFLGIADAQVKTPQSSPATEVEQMVGLTKIELEYSRPAKKNREIFGNLVPFDKVWRTGANKNTTIEFDDDVTIDGQILKEGKYAIYTKPGKDAWEIYFYSKNDNWGNPEKWDDAMVAAKTTSKVQTLPQSVESFTIALENIGNSTATLQISWDKTRVETTIEVPTDKKVMESIQKTMAGNPEARDYMSAANYFFANGKDIQQAKNWMDEGMKMNPKPMFYQIYQQALIHQKAGDKKSALELAKKSLDASKAAGSDDYIKMNNDLIKELSK